MCGSENRIELPLIFFSAGGSCCCPADGAAVREAVTSAGYTLTGN